MRLHAPACVRVVFSPMYVGSASLCAVVYARRNKSASFSPLGRAPTTAATECKESREEQTAAGVHARRERRRMVGRRGSRCVRAAWQLCVCPALIARCSSSPAVCSLARCLLLLQLLPPSSHLCTQLAVCHRRVFSGGSTCASLFHLQQRVCAPRIASSRLFRLGAAAAAAA